LKMTIKMPDEVLGGRMVLDRLQSFLFLLQDIADPTVEAALKARKRRGHGLPYQTMVREDINIALLWPARIVEEEGTEEDPVKMEMRELLEATEAMFRDGVLLHNPISHSQHLRNSSIDRNHPILN